MQPIKTMPTVPNPTSAPTMELRVIPKNEILDELEAVLNESADLNGDGVFDSRDLDEARNQIRDWINLKIDVPWIGEKIEGLAIGFVLGMLMRLARRLGEGRVRELIGKLR